LAEVVPGLGRHIEAGMLHRDALRVDPHRLGTLLFASLLRRGGRVRWGTPALALDVRGERVHGVRLPGEILPGGAVVLATGAEAAGLWPEGAAPLPLAAQRWTEVVLDGVPPPPVAIVGRGRLVVPQDTGRVALVSASEGGDYQAVASAATLRRTLDAADLLPAVAEGRVAAVTARLGPAMADGLPLMGGWPGLDGLAVAVGAGWHGFTLGPLMADVVYALLFDVAVPFNLGPFRPDRGEA
jgi:glycine/D-amino acid oxidase-like deaminating enzyme